MEESMVAYLIEAKAKHEIDIKYLKRSRDKINAQLKEIHGNLQKFLAAYEAKEKRKQSSLSFFQTLWEYKHAIAISIALLSSALSFLFGYHFKGFLLDVL